MKFIYSSLLLFSFLFSNNISFAQISKLLVNDNVDVTLIDGNKISGKILKIETKSIVIESASLGEIAIEKDQISSLKILNTRDLEIDNSGFPKDYYNSTHYFGNSSAYTLKQGQKYYQNIGIFFNTFSFGVTDNFTISVGGEIASLLFAGRFPIIYVSPKFSIPFENESGAFGVSATFFSSPADEFEAFGIVQGNITLGSRNNNFTAGVGFGFSTSGGFTDEIIPIQLSYMYRASKKISFVTDNFLLFYNGFGDTVGILSAGVRIHFSNVGSALDIGLWRTTEDQDVVFAFPFVSATIPLGK